MTVLITDHRTILNEADSITNWTGSPTLFTTDPDPVESTGCIGYVVSTATVDAFVTIASTNISGSLIYVWAFPRGAMDTTANGGMSIHLGDGTNRVAFHLAGSDIAPFRHDEGPVGWQCMVLDTLNLPAARTIRAGTFAGLNLSAITQIGATFKTLAKSVGGVSNCFVDIIRSGNPNINDGAMITITSGSLLDPGTFEDIATSDRNTTNQFAYGILRKLGAGSYGAQGALRFGNATGSLSSWFEDKNVSLTFERRGLRSTRYRIVVVDNGVGTTTFKLGTKSGTGDSATGIDGCILTAPSGTGASFEASGSAIHNVGIYGSTISGFTNGIRLSSDPIKGPTHEFLGNNISACGIFEPGRVVVRNCRITGWIGNSEDAALLWNANADVKRCQFTSAGSGHAIKIINTGTYTFDGLNFSGYGSSGTLNAALYNNSSGSVTINVVGGGNTPTVRNGTGSSTTINSNVSITLTGLRNPSEVRVFSAGTTTEIAGQENVTLGTFSFSVGSGVPVDIAILSLGYQNQRILNFSATADTTIPIQQQLDRQYNNP